MHDDEGSKAWREARDRRLLEEFRSATGKAAKSMEEAEKWFLGLPPVEQDRIGRRMSDLDIIGRHLLVRAKAFLTPFRVIIAVGVSVVGIVLALYLLSRRE